MKFSILSAIIGLIFIAQTKGQEIWNLKKCIDHAFENNIQIKQAQLNTELANANLWQVKSNTLPTLSGNASHLYNYGRTIDPFTNQFADNLIRSNNFSLSSNLNLFSGFQNVNSVRQNQMEYLASRYDLEKARNDIALNIATAYLQVLFAEELLAIAENQLNVTQQQVDRTSRLVEAGTLARGSLFEVEAQYATEELQVVNSRNQYDLSYLSLKQLLDLPNNQPFMIEKPKMDLLPAGEILGTKPDAIYAYSRTVMPEIKSAELRTRSSEMGVHMARGSLLPRVFLNGSLGTGFSGLRSRITGFSTGDPQFVPIGFTQDQQFVYRENIVPVTEIIPFNEQVRDNFNQSFGIFATIPIFNNLQSRTAISRAKIARYNAEYNLQLAELQLNRNVTQAHADAMAALKKYAATQKALEALQESFRYAEQRFNVGVMHALDYNNAKNRLVNAQSELLQAKYDFLFKLKVLDFFQGKPLTLE
jgi:outer membrane protein